MNKVRVLFVCLGNICRSPLGAALLKKKLESHGLDHRVEVDSCGTSNYNVGDNADPRTVANARKNGLSIEHCARQLSAGDLDDFDFIFAMDKANYSNILKISNGNHVRHKVKLMREFDPESGGGEVPDPYHGDERNFQEVFEILDRATSNFTAYLKKDYFK